MLSILKLHRSYGYQEFTGLNPIKYVVLSWLSLRYSVGLIRKDHPRDGQYYHITLLVGMSGTGQLQFMVDVYLRLCSMILKVFSKLDDPLVLYFKHPFTRIHKEVFNESALFQQNTHGFYSFLLTVGMWKSFLGAVAMKFVYSCIKISMFNCYRLRRSVTQPLFGAIAQNTGTTGNTGAGNVSSGCQPSSSIFCPC